MIRTGHPFPSLLNALATTAIATLAGAPPLTAGRLGLSMLALQVSIGALNDWADAPSDAVSKQRKPIAAGLVDRGAALGLAGGGLLVGLLLSLVSSAGVALVALAGAGLGYVYDLRLSRTFLSWLPLSLALPLLPLHAWLGATGSIPTGLLTVVPVAVLAGVVLALSNGLVDLERDRATGKAGIVLRLGQGRAWLANVAFTTVLVVLVVLTIPSIPRGLFSDRPGSIVPFLAELQWLGTLGGFALLALGAAVLRARAAGLRERGWELQAVGVGTIGIAWMAGVAASTAVASAAVTVLR